MPVEVQNQNKWSFTIQQFQCSHLFISPFLLLVILTCWQHIAGISTDLHGKSSIYHWQKSCLRHKAQHALSHFAELWLGNIPDIQMIYHQAWHCVPSLWAFVKYLRLTQSVSYAVSRQCWVLTWTWTKGRSGRTRSWATPPSAGWRHQPAAWAVCRCIMPSAVYQQHR